MRLAHPAIVHNRAAVRRAPAMGQPETRLASITIAHPGLAAADRATATARAIRTAGAPPGRAATTTHPMGPAVMRSSALIRRGPILHQAAAILRRLAPTLRRAAAMALMVAEGATGATTAIVAAGALVATVEVAGATTVVMAVAAVAFTVAVAAAASTVAAAAAASTVAVVAAAPTVAVATMVANTEF